MGAGSAGLTITLPHDQAPNPCITPDLAFRFHCFALRKMHFSMRAKAAVASAQAAVTVAQAGFAQARASLALSQSKLIRAETLGERGVVTGQDLVAEHLAQVKAGVRGVAWVRRAGPDGTLPDWPKGLAPPLATALPVAVDDAASGTGE